MIKIYFLSLFPEILRPVLASSLLGKAWTKRQVEYHLIQIRDFAKDKHRIVDDTPYGGGAGMLLKPDVLFAAWRSALPRRSKRAMTILLSPQGEPFNQKAAKELTKFQKLILVCGHYEGVDERFIDLCVDREISIGDYVLTGGEIPALALADTVTRLIPGVVGNQNSLSEESLEKGLLKYPQYTRPRVFQGLTVPDVLLSGDHVLIQKWRAEERRKRTVQKRPDLFKHSDFSKNS